MTRPAKPACTYEHVNRMTARHGWFREQLWLMEHVLWGRWSYWLAVCLNGTIGELPEWAIPQVPFAADWTAAAPPGPLVDRLAGQPHGPAILEMVGSPREAHRHTIKTLERASDHGNNHLQVLIDWWLWAFGSPRVMERPRISERGAVVLYSDFELQRLVGNPGDWGSAIALEFVGTKKSTGWFPTPLNVAEMMVRMTFPAEGDARLLSTLDPAVGAGVFLLAASNYSLDLYGVDIDPLMCALCEFACWLFVPWLVYGNKGLIREFREKRAREAAERPTIPAGHVEVGGRHYRIPDGADAESTIESLRAAMAEV